MLSRTFNPLKKSSLLKKSARYCIPIRSHSVTAGARPSRFFAKRNEEFDQLRADLRLKPEEMKESLKPEKEDIVPLAEERDKVFAEKKMTIKDHLHVMVHHFKKSMTAVGVDTYYLFKLLKKKQMRDEAYSVLELRERRRISKDLMKFVPYSVFMTIPLLEAFLPLYMVLFPNSMPTQFFFDKQIGEKVSNLVEKQRDSYTKIIPLIPKFANVMGLDPLKFVDSINDIMETEGKEKDRLFYKMSDFESRLAVFAKNYQDADERNKRVISFNNMTAYELEQTAKLLCLDYIPGYNLINKCIWTFTRLPFLSYNYLQTKLKKEKTDFSQYGFYRFEFRFDSGPAALLKKLLLKQQIEFHLNKIKVEDRQLSKDLHQLETLPVAHLASIARQRGIKIENPDNIKSYLEKKWLPMSVGHDLPVDVLVWISFMRYSYAEVLV
jgi:LETM1 and EF-hand domain-containing protein 1